MIINLLKTTQMFSLSFNFLSSIVHVEMLFTPHFQVHHDLLKQLFSLNVKLLILKGAGPGKNKTSKLFLFKS